MQTESGAGAPVPPRLPTGITPLFERLDQQLSHLHLLWRVYRQLFGTSAHQVEVLNKTAPVFAHVVQAVMQDAVYLGLTRLTDPAKTGGRPNLTFRRLEAVLDRPAYSGLRRRLAEALRRAETLCRPFRNHRNRRIAHNDLQEAQRATFTRPSRRDVEAALEGLRGFMNALNTHFRLGPVAYEHVRFGGGGDSLVHYLEAGLRLQGLRRRVGFGQLAGQALVDEIMARPLGMDGTAFRECHSGGVDG